MKPPPIPTRSTFTYASLSGLDQSLNVWYFTSFISITFSCFWQCILYNFLFLNRVNFLSINLQAEIESGISIFTGSILEVVLIACAKASLPVDAVIAFYPHH